MAVSAYACLLSLTHFLDNLHYRAQFQIPRADIKQVETLQEHVRVLLEFVELRSEDESQKIKDLWRSIAEAAFEAEDKINFHVVTQLQIRSLGGTSDVGFSDFCDDVERVIQKFHSIRERLPTVKEEGDDVQTRKQPRASVPAPPTPTSSTGQGFLVGLDEHVGRVIDMLTGNESNLQILPIVGMGGIGKTTLAKSVYDHQSLSRYFDKRIWLTISQGYSAEEILRGLLNDELSKSLDDLGSSQSLADLGETLYKELYDIRYLIVMDDMWSRNAWDELKCYFPENMIRSRIILTTRNLSLGTSLGSCKSYELTFLNEDKSWDLFCQNAFGQVGCPHAYLENVAKRIVESCKGLPLAIVVIARLLANSNLTLKFWKFVADNIISLGNKAEGDHCLKVLSLSYKSLPIHLKLCFLYVRNFPEDDSIDVSDLINRCICEGFIKPVSGKCLTDTALEYVKDLINRNLVFTRSIEHCDVEEIGVHDLLRDLCLRESEHENFIRSPKVQHSVSMHGRCILCGESIKDNNRVYLPHLVNIYQSSRKSTPTCDACGRMYEHITRPLIVWTIVTSARDDYPNSIPHSDKIVQPTEVRFASIRFSSALEFPSPPTIHLLWNLQILYIYQTHGNSRDMVLPPHIWEMPQLRHICVYNDTVILSNPIPIHIVGKDSLVLKNLEKLSGIKNFEFTDGILDRIPNLRKLKIVYDAEMKDKYGIRPKVYSLDNLVQLQKLVSLSVNAHCSNVLKTTLTFPESLKELSLYSYHMAWEYMSIIGSLPCLERLILFYCVSGSQWKPIQGQFRRLKYLSIEYSDLIHWSVDKNHFPILEHLNLSWFYNLEEIPSPIGYISTLQSIKLSH